MDTEHYTSISIDTASSVCREDDNEDYDEPHLEHLRLMLRKIKRRKAAMKNKSDTVEKQLARVNLIVSTLLVIQVALSASQTTVLADVDRRIVGILSLISMTVGCALGCVVKFAHTQRNVLQKLLVSYQKWDKAEDAFVMEMGVCMQDGVLTSEEHLRLNGIYEVARDFVDGSLDEQSENYFTLYSKDGKHGSGTLHTPDSRFI